MFLVLIPLQTTDRAGKQSEICMLFQNYTSDYEKKISFKKINNYNLLLHVPSKHDTPKYSWQMDVKISVQK